MAAVDRDGRGHGAKSLAVRDLAVQALVTERTVPRAAKRAGVAERTLRRWLSDDEQFKAAYARARDAAFLGAMQRVQAMAAHAVETLADLLSRPTQAHVRLGAARTVLELAVRERETADIVNRLDELEALVNRQTEAGNR